MKKSLLGSCFIPKVTLTTTSLFLVALLWTSTWGSAYSATTSTVFFQHKTTVTLRYKHIKLEKLLNKIETDTGVDFLYNVADINLKRSVAINVTDAPIKKALKTIFNNTDVQFEIRGDQIVLYKRKATPPTHFNATSSLQGTVQQQILVHGTVTDEKGKPLVGVNVSTLGNPGGTATNAKGEYTIGVKKEDILVFSYIGFQTQKVSVSKKLASGSSAINIILKPSAKQLQGVVITTGVVKRKKTSFTGAVHTVTGEELKRIGNQNIIQSLKTLDPSFTVLENNLAGSNPNAMPKIEVRGKTSLPTNTIKDQFSSDPNAPLFILDGFQTDIQTVMDLNLNRVKSITILKDAASTALYGAKAANGVVVIETKRPKPGELRVSYTGDFNIEYADLSDYNLMNAEEKLKFEKLAGRWISHDHSAIPQVALDSLYNVVLADVRRGVNTYWLDKPLQTGFSQRHSVYVDGGNKNLQFGAGLSLKNTTGVMKGSGRKNYGANIDLTYRKGNLNISNRLYLSGYTANESPYGSFKKFAQANPYYRPTDTDGKIAKYLDQVSVQGFYDYTMVNPLYSSTLNNKNETTDFGFRDNINAIWTINSKLRASAGLQIRKTNSTQEIFVSPESAQFDEVSFLEKGEYYRLDTKQHSYSGNLMLTYHNVFAERHALTFNLRTEIEERSSTSYGTRAVGFPLGATGNPNFAFGYQPDAKPTYNSNTYRRNNVLASVNYAYDQRYLLDATFRMDGSTAFGSNKQYSPFWSVGLGWNIHKEFNFNPEIVNLLKLRGNIGYTGNQGFGSLVSVSTYNFNNSTNIFGQGIGLQTLANPNLEWQKTLQSDVGIDLGMFDDRLNATIDVYEKYTHPLIVTVDLPSSTGIFNYPMNVGHLKTRGIDAIIKYSPIYNLKDRIIWTLGVTASAYNSTYGGFDNALKNLNDAAKESRSLIRFKDGYSPADIWAVRSLGIDPATGNEVFLKKNGETTFEYDFADEVVVGNTTPDVEGVISSRFRYKNFSLGIHLRYRLGGDAFNTALYNKVENIGNNEVIYNQDRRALYDRWQQPGDVAKFKAISMTSYTPISSRFVQKENVLIGESFRLGYQVYDAEWLDYLGLKSLNFNMYMNDIFRISSIETERGINYPFARTISFSVNLTF